MEYIIIDLRTNKALYALEGKTIRFSTEQGAEEFAKQMCLTYIVIGIKY
jgi:hypothetical protein